MSIRSTILTRVQDALPLAASVDDEKVKKRGGRGRGGWRRLTFAERGRTSRIQKASQDASEESE